MELTIIILVWYRHTHVVGINQLMSSQPLRIDNWISNGNAYIINDKNMHIFDSTQKANILSEIGMTI
jgi:hypothetical protein